MTGLREASPEVLITLAVVIGSIFILKSIRDGWENIIIYILGFIQVIFRVFVILAAIVLMIPIDIIGYVISIFTPYEHESKFVGMITALKEGEEI